MENKKNRVYAKYIKRMLDFCAAAAALIILSPLLLVLMAAGAIAMKGNPFFFQERPGKIDPATGKERIFKLIKFRTMSNAKDKEGNLLPDSVRLNRYGRVLRSLSLDELGELLNIVRGDMSFVGPRPLLCSYIEYYSELEHQRHTVRPGLTGLAQASGRNGLTWKSRFEKDVEYVENVSFSMDLKVLLMTVKKVFAREGIEFSGNETIMEYFANYAERDDKAKVSYE